MHTLDPLVRQAIIVSIRTLLKHLQTDDVEAVLQEIHKALDRIEQDC